MKRPHWLHMRLARLFRSRKSEQNFAPFLNGVLIGIALYWLGNVVYAAAQGRFVIGGR